MVKGKFIVFEGIDGCGKDTQIKLLKEQLENNGKEVVLYSNIDHGPLKDVCRSLLEPGNPNFVSSYHLSILVLTNMVITHKHIKDDLLAGKTVLCSRWYLSSLAYGGRKSDIEYDTIKSYIKTLNIDPDLFVYISTDPNIALSRITSRDETNERYDTIDKLNNIRNCYSKAISEQLSPSVIVDGNGPINDVFQEILSYLYFIDR